MRSACAYQNTSYQKSSGAASFDDRNSQEGSGAACGCLCLDRGGGWQVANLLIAIRGRGQGQVSIRPGACLIVQPFSQVGSGLVRPAYVVLPAGLCFCLACL